MFQHLLVQNCQIKKRNYKKVDSLKFKSFKQIADMFEEFKTSVVEKAIVVYLDKDNNIMGFTLDFIGTQFFIAMDLKIFIRNIILTKAKKVIFIHNHPSGNGQPSVADCEVIHNLHLVLNFLKVEILGALVLSQEGGYNEYYGDSLKFIRKRQTHKSKLSKEEVLLK